MQRWIRVIAALFCALALGVAVTVPATAEPASPPTATIDHINHVTDRWLQVFVNSPSMGRVVQVDLLLPPDTSVPRPTVYLLEGGQGVLPDQNDWTYQGGAVDFFADKQVNVVLPVGATGSYYTDWQRDDPTLGRQKWETFLTKEVPPLFDAHFDGNGHNAVAGVSMGAQAALMLAERTGDLYKGVASYSGCYYTSDPAGQAELRFIVSSVGGDAENMWGPPNDPDWVAHDTLLNAGGLRGKMVYVSVGTGLPGRYEVPGAPDVLNTAVAGGALEAVTHYCTTELDATLHADGVPATFVYNPNGTHSWPYWVDQLAASWPDLAAALAN